MPATLITVSELVELPACADQVQLNLAATKLRTGREDAAIAHANKVLAHARTRARAHARRRPEP